MFQLQKAELEIVQSRAQDGTFLSGAEGESFAFLFLLELKDKSSAVKCRGEKVNRIDDFNLFYIGLYINPGNENSESICVVLDFSIGYSKTDLQAISDLLF